MNHRRYQRGRHRDFAVPRCSQKKYIRLVDRVHLRVKAQGQGGGLAGDILAIELDIEEDLRHVVGNRGAEVAVDGIKDKGADLEDRTQKAGGRARKRSAPERGLVIGVRIRPFASPAWRPAQTRRGWSGSTM